MSIITKVSVCGKVVPQLFFRRTYKEKAPADLSYDIDKVLQDHTPSLVGVTNQKDIVLKLIRPRRWHEIAKLFWGHSRVSKEIRGNFKFQDLGLNIPEIFESGYAFLPVTHYEFIGYYLMENLATKGYDEVFNLFHQEDLTSELRKMLFSQICDGLKTLQNNRIVFTDFTLGNVFGGEDGSLFWIDTGVSSYNRLEQNKFIKKNNQSIERFVSIHNDLLLEEEKQQIRQLKL